MLKQILFSIFLVFFQFTRLQTNSTHPNFILILADDQGWNGTSVKMMHNELGSKSDYFETPNLELLANRGIRFSDAYASGKTFISGASNDVITMNGSTKGGLAGSIVKVTAIADNKYAVEGIILGSGTIVTPFADA